MNQLRNFFVFEGLDGAGTTTQSKILCDFLNSQAIQTVRGCEPTDSPIGKRIRTALSGKEAVSSQSMALLFAADRSLHCEEIQSYLNTDNKVYISDRYIYSSLAYQGLDLPEEWLISLQSRFLVPEITFFLDIPAEIGEDRMKNRNEREIFENIEDQLKIRNRYLEVFKKYPQFSKKIVILDGRKKVDEISSEIKAHLPTFKM